MEWSQQVYEIGVGVGLVLIALALIVLVAAAVPLMRETRRLAVDLRRLVALTETELRPTLAELREVTATLAVLGREMGPRLERLDRLAATAERTLEAVRVASQAVSRWTDLPAASMASVAAGLRRAGSIFGRGRAAGGPVESGDETEDRA